MAIDVWTPGQMETKSIVEMERRESEQTSFSLEGRTCTNKTKKTDESCFLSYHHRSLTVTCSDLKTFHSSILASSRCCLVENIMVTSRDSLEGLMVEPQPSCSLCGVKFTYAVLLNKQMFESSAKYLFIFQKGRRRVLH